MNGVLYYTNFVKTELMIIETNIEVPKLCTIVTSDTVKLCQGHHTMYVDIKLLFACWSGSNSKHTELTLFMGEKVIDYSLLTMKLYFCNIVKRNCIIL